MDCQSSLPGRAACPAERLSPNLAEALCSSPQRCWDLHRRITGLEAEVETLHRRIEKLEAENEWLKRRVFGRRSEKHKIADRTAETTTDAVASASEASAENPTARAHTKTRGGQPGHQGHGRKIPHHLPREERFYAIPEAQRRCPCCGLLVDELPMTEDAYEIDVRVQYVLIVHRRKKYKPGCSCHAGPSLITAPAPAKIIPKGKFTVPFWSKTIVDKYLFQLPIQRQTLAMRLEGLAVPKATLIGGFAALAPFFSPLYEALIQISRQQRHWHIDETRWLVFAEREGKTSHRWWLWVFASKLVICYVLDPSRSKTVPQNHLGENVTGIISVDRYSVYKSLSKTTALILAFCWSHVRRDFDNLVHRYQNHRDKKYLADWAAAWIEKIANLYRLNDARVAALDRPPEFEQHHQRLLAALANMEAESKQDYPHWEQKKVMASLRNHWAGLTVFVDHPEIPMDNNEAERRLRNPALGRNNYYGHHAEEAGLFAAMQFTIIQTCLLHGLNPNAYLSYYLQACAQQQSHKAGPADLAAYLPHVIKEKALQGDPTCRQLLMHISDDP